MYGSLLSPRGVYLHGGVCLCTCVLPRSLCFWCIRPLYYAWTWSRACVRYGTAACLYITVYACVQRGIVVLVLHHLAHAEAVRRMWENAVNAGGPVVNGTVLQKLRRLPLLLVLFDALRCHSDFSACLFVSMSIYTRVLLRWRRRTVAYFLDSRMRASFLVRSSPHVLQF